MARDLMSRGGGVGPVDWFGRSLLNLRDDMDRFFHDMWSDGEKRGFAFPAIDVTENDDKFKVKAELHGMDPEDVDLSIEDGYLTIQGERREEHEAKDKKETYLHREISFGSFRRVIPLPETADIDKADASFEKGVLTIDVPKKEEAIGHARKLRIANRDPERTQGSQSRRA